MLSHHSGKAVVAKLRIHSPATSGAKQCAFCHYRSYSAPADNRLVFFNDYRDLGIIDYANTIATFTQVRTLLQLQPLVPILSFYIAELYYDMRLMATD
jgi:hypothetical protein